MVGRLDENYRKKDEKEKAPPVLEGKEKSKDKKKDITKKKTAVKEKTKGEIEKIKEKAKLNKLEKQYLQKIQSLEKHKKSDRNSFAIKSVQEIRNKIYLLSPLKGNENNTEKIKNTKAETARRMAIYTSLEANGFYTLNYKKVGGIDHEMGIGLGDILLDPDIKEILVKRQNGEEITAIRGAPKRGRHKGRPSFIDKDTGDYVATLSGDKFRIISGKEINLASKKEEAAYLTELANRDKLIQSYKSEPISQTKFNLSGKPNAAVYVGGKFDRKSYRTIISLDGDKPVVDQINWGETNVNLLERKKSNAKIIESVFKKLSGMLGLSGVKLANMIAAAIANAERESGLKHSAVGDSGHSKGLFQFNDKYNSGGSDTAPIGDWGNDPNKDWRLDPVQNTAKIALGLLKGRGLIVLKAAKNGASTEELSVLLAAYRIKPAWSNRENAKYSQWSDERYIAMRRKKENGQIKKIQDFFA